MGRRDARAYAARMEVASQLRRGHGPYGRVVFRQSLVGKGNRDVALSILRSTVVTQPVNALVPRKLRRIVAALSGALGIAVLLTAVAPEAAIVWYPIIVATGVLFVFLECVRPASGGPARVFEIGPIYAFAVWVYTCYPLAGFLINGMEYGTRNDMRLYLGAPAPVEVARIGWMYVVLLSGFASGYVTWRGTDSVAPSARLGRLEGVVLLLVFIASQVYTLHHRVAVSMGLSRAISIDTWRSRGPQLTAQVTGHIGGVRLTAAIALLAYLFQRYGRYRVLIFGWLGVVAIKTITERQSRTTRRRLSRRVDPLRSLCPKDRNSDARARWRVWVGDIRHPGITSFHQCSH